MAAIYIPPWPLTEIYTSTLYPIEVVESLGIVAGIVNGTMELPYIDHAASIEPIVFLSTSYIQKRWFYEYGPIEDNVEIAPAEFLATSYIQRRWFYAHGPVEDNVEIEPITLLTVSYIRKQVSGEAPVEELQVTLNMTTSSNMVVA